MDASDWCGSNVNVNRRSLASEEGRGCVGGCGNLAADYSKKDRSNCGRDSGHPPRLIGTLEVTFIVKGENAGLARSHVDQANLKMECLFVNQRCGRRCSGTCWHWRRRAKEGVAN